MKKPGSDEPRYICEDCDEEWCSAQREKAGDKPEPDVNIDEASERLATEILTVLIDCAYMHGKSQVVVGRVKHHYTGAFTIAQAKLRSTAERACTHSFRAGRRCSR